MPVSGMMSSTGSSGIRVASPPRHLDPMQNRRKPVIARSGADVAWTQALSKAMVDLLDRGTDRFVIRFFLI